MKIFFISWKVAAIIACALGRVKTCIIARMMLPALLRSMRPRQWTKNAFIFAPIVFDRQLLDLPALLRTAAGFALLCLIASAVYLMNDLADIERDRQHPSKRLRPLPAGLLSPRVAALTAVGLVAVAFPLALRLDWRFGVVAAVYFVENVLYSFWLKKVAVLDVLMVALGFVLRVGAGVTLIHVQRFSPWLYLCITLLALFIGFGKRRHELSLLAQGANTHRATLDDYSIPLLDQMIGVVTATTVLAYSLYTFTASGLPENDAMMLTIPFVLYGIFRYLYLIHVRGQGGAPDEIVLSDRPLQITVALWGLSVFIIMYLFRFPLRP